MRILAFSDLHSNAEHAKAIVAASAGADLVLAAGDFCNFQIGLDEAMALLAPIPCPVLAVPGNHETMDTLIAAAPKNMTVLHGQSVEIGGLCIFGIGCGIPDQPLEPWSSDLTEAAATELLETCHQADIILSHAPPKNIADQIHSGQNVGSTALRTAVERLQPKLFLCGHIHEAWGQIGTIQDTHVVNLGPSINWFELDT